MHEHQADGAGADDDHGVARAGTALFQAADDAGERFSEGGVFKRSGGGDGEGVFGDDTGGDADVLGVGSVVEEEILAEVLLAVAAEETDVAGCGVESDDAVADFEGGYSFAGLYDGSGDLVAEGNGRLQHFGVVAATVDFEIGTAGEGRADPEDQFAGGSLRDGNVLQSQVFLAVEHRC